MSAALEPTEIQVHTPEVAFTCLTQGEGPLVLLVHGFPDIPQTWSAQMHALSQAGYRVIAPYLPGYLPSRAADNAYFDKASLVHGIAGLIEAVSPGNKLHYIGQDWGAIIGYALCAARPDLLHSAVLMAVPGALITLLAGHEIDGLAIVDIARKEGLAEGMAPIEGGVAFHMACHSRAQNMGQKAAEMLKLLPEADVAVEAHEHALMTRLSTSARRNASSISSAPVLMCSSSTPVRSTSCSTRVMYSGSASVPRNVRRNSAPRRS